MEKDAAPKASLLDDKSVEDREEELENATFAAMKSKIAKLD